MLVLRFTKLFCNKSVREELLTYISPLHLKYSTSQHQTERTMVTESRETFPTGLAWASGEMFVFLHHSSVCIHSSDFQHTHVKQSPLEAGSQMCHDLGNAVVTSSQRRWEQPRVFSALVVVSHCHIHRIARFDSTATRTRIEEAIINFGIDGRWCLVPAGWIFRPPLWNVSMVRCRLRRFKSYCIVLFSGPNGEDRSALINAVLGRQRPRIQLTMRLGCSRTMIKLFVFKSAPAAWRND